MSKGPTKAQLALTEAREWIEASKVEVAEREKALTEARSQLEMHETIYAILEKTFTRQPAKTATKKASKKSSKSLTKSQRASSIQQQIQGRGKTSTGTPDDDSDALCRYKFESGMVCESSSGNPVHDPLMAYAGYHEFQPAEQAASASGGD